MKDYVKINSAKEACEARENLLKQMNEDDPFFFLCFRRGDRKIAFVKHGHTDDEIVALFANAIYFYPEIREHIKRAEELVKQKEQ